MIAVLLEVHPEFRYRICGDSDKLSQRIYVPSSQQPRNDGLSFVFRADVRCEFGIYVCPSSSDLPDIRC